MLALQVGEIVIIDCGSYGLTNYRLGYVTTITAKRGYITVEDDYGKTIVFNSGGSEKKVKGMWNRSDRLLKCTAENMEKYEKHKRKTKVMSFVRNFDGEDENMVDKIYEIIKEK